jgi:hypothetical protein
MWTMLRRSRATRRGAGPGTAAAGRRWARWRRSDGVNQSVQALSLLVASLSIATGMVAFGPSVGGTIGTLWGCRLNAPLVVSGSDPCLEPDGPGPAPFPPVETPPPPPPGTTEIVDPGSVTPGGSYDPWGGPKVDFAWCWRTYYRSSGWLVITSEERRLCQDVQGNAWACDAQVISGQVPYVTETCTPADETRYPDLVTCQDRPDGTRSCQATVLDSVLRDGRTQFFEDPSIRGSGLFWPVGGTVQRTYEDALAYCQTQLAACNAQLDLDLADVIGMVNTVHDRFAACDGAVQGAYDASTVAVHTIAGPDGRPGVEIKIGNGWTNLADLQELVRSNPNRVGAIVYVLYRTLNDYYTTTGGRSRPAQEVVGLEAMISAISLPAFAAGLRNLSTDPALTLEGFTCDAVAAEFGLAASTPHVEGAAGGYTDVCVVPGPDGGCARWVSAPNTFVSPVEPGTEVDVPGASIGLTSEERNSGRVVGLVPGVPDASYDEALAYCRANPADCDTKAKQGLLDTQRKYFDLMEGIGLCPTDADCTTLAGQIAAEAQSRADCDPAGGAVGAAINYKLLVSQLGVTTMCGFLGGVGAFSLAGSSPYLASLVGAMGGAFGFVLSNMVAAYMNPAAPVGMAPEDAVTLAMFDGQLQQQLAPLAAGQAELRLQVLDLQQALAGAAVQGYTLPVWLGIILARVGLARRPHVG